jgi:hypothetical protein
MNELTITGNNPVANIKASTDVAGACKEIVERSAIKIQGRKYVPVEGWMAIATAHGCNLSASDVKQIDGGISARGIVRRISDGLVIGEAEGFVGDDEKTWANRPLYARRAMAQTRAMSRAARSVFAHVVVLMDAGLSTTPAEEMAEIHEEKDVSSKPAQPKPTEKKYSNQSLINGFVSKFEGYVKARDEYNIIHSCQKIAEYKSQLNGDWSAIKAHVYDVLHPCKTDHSLTADNAKVLAKACDIIEIEDLAKDFRFIEAAI